MKRGAQWPSFGEGEMRWTNSAAQPKTPDYVSALDFSVTPAPIVHGKFESSLFYRQTKETRASD
jgi:hypothetical protein